MTNLRQGMGLHQASGARLAWLWPPEGRMAEIRRGDEPCMARRLGFATRLGAGDVLGGWVFELEAIWRV